MIDWIASRMIAIGSATVMVAVIWHLIQEKRRRA